MSFRVNLYEFSKRSNSTLRPSGNGYVADCRTNEPVDLMAPVLKFDLSGPFNYNYLYVQNWDRYYWIDSWNWDNGIWTCSCSIDPLASWRNSIGNMTEYVLRSSYAFDGDIVDTTYPLQAETQVVQNFLPDWSVSSGATGCHVVGIVGANGLVEYYRIDNLPEFGAYMFGTNPNSTIWDEIIADDPGVQAGGYPSFMKAQFNPLQYVVNCIWYPFSIPTSGNKVHVYFGYFDSGYQAYKINRSSYTIFSSRIPLHNHPQYTRGRYLNYAPYTRLRLSALPWGEVDLDTTKFANQTEIVLQAWVDPITGSSKLYVANEYSDVILTLVGQIGVTEQLSQVLKDNLATVTGAASAAAGLIGGILGGPAALAGGIATAISGIGSAAAAQYPDVSSTGTNGARIAVTPTQIRLTQTFQWVVGDDPENRGRPLCQRVNKLKELKGYIMVADPDVPLPATQEEIDKIKEYMANGFFYE